MALIALDTALAPLRDHSAGEIPLLPVAGRFGQIAPGVSVSADPAARFGGSWQSPAGRLLDITTDITTPGIWLGLHITLPGFDIAACTWLGLAARVTARASYAIPVCLRSNLAGQPSQDIFLQRQILAQSRESDHSDLLCFGWHPDIAPVAQSRELILFLHPAQSNRVVIHDLRIFAL